jgi:serine/threonine-protein kinase
VLKPGDTIDRYVIDAVLGEGGMGSVYRARDPRLDRQVAVKIVRTERGDSGEDRAATQEATARLLREARAAAKLDHPNAISIFDVGEAESSGVVTAFIAMELVSGVTVRKLARDGQSSLRDRIRILCDVARALSAAHKSGIVHRDIKPENVMVRTDGVVKVLDFGIARRTQRELDPTAPTETGALLTLTAQGVPIGTPLYMAPEQVHGEPVDGRSDQFSWGVLAYELFAGKVPWANKTDAMALAGAILTQAAPPLVAACPDLDPEVARVIHRALEKKPADRFASMEEIIAALEVALGSSPGSAPKLSNVSAPVASPAPAASRSPSSPPPASREPRYTTETARAILSLALERQAEQPTSTGYAPDEVLAAAREVGVDDETLAAAAHEVAERRNAEAKVVEEADKRRRKLMRGVASYCVVNLFLIFVAGFHAAKWVMLGWGFGLALQAVKVFFPEPEKKDAKTKKRIAAPVDPTVARGADDLFRTVAARRVRVGAVGGGRSSSSDAREAREALAEAEAAQAQQSPRKRL